jgi:branched-chain amino acid transport system substrate-binding protein
MGILSTPDLRDRKYYVIVHDYAWGYDVAERFIKLAKANDIEVVNDRYARAPIRTKDWSSYITKIKASGADGVYVGFITDVIPAFVKQARQYGLKAKIVSGALPGPKALQACGEDCVGVVAAGDWAWDVDTPNSNAWEKRFWDKYQLIPSDAAAHSYCGAMNLFRAIERAGTTEPERVAACLKGVSFDGPYGHVRISALDNCMRNSAVLTETKIAPDNPYGAKIYMEVLHTFPWYAIQRGELELKDKKLILKPYDTLKPLE